MRESTIEKALVKAVRESGGLAIKLVSPGWAGAPDRLILMPGGKLAFVELKAPRHTMRPLQVKRKRQLEALGFSVYCIDQPSQIAEVVHSTTSDSDCLQSQSVASTGLAPGDGRDGGVVDEVCAP